MADILESRSLPRARSDAPKANTDSGAGAMLATLLPRCCACQGPLDDHSYRFFACHPMADASDPALAAFLAAIHEQDWTAVQANQQPSVDLPIFVLYALACPHSPASTGMIALLRTQPGSQNAGELVEQRALTAESMAALRAQCPTCPWILFNARPDPL